MDPTWNPNLKPGLAELADLAALTDRNTTNATAGHELTAAELWTALHQLGVDGRMLVVGEDPEVYAGLPRTERLISPGVIGQLVGRVPGASWPHTQLHLQQAGAAPNPVDLVIANIPVNDLVIHSAEAAAQHWQGQAVNALGSVALTRPNGLTVLLASSRLLDDTEPYPRREMSRMTEFLGALRLPAGTFRHAPGNDGTVDLILLHNSGTPGRIPFTASVPVTLDGRTVHINEYYDTHPEHVLGTLTSRDNPWGPADTTVVPDHTDLATELRTALTDITAAARARGLITRPEPTGTGAPIFSAAPRPGSRPPTRSSAIPAQTLRQVRAVVARLRAQHRRSDPAAPDRPTPRRAPGPEPESPEL